eukprot:CAMPEP_0170207682 /NCGR_PEP_ID=MMETSP0116_2-20130129/3420_1 /TAXON_ID=400756 /ORGANISM="Durinskia baltica, Strain CSIRO CS-38" /LENGTH=164 /DNA_ID=CAMNT_0010458143 /DNA_START=134 /DNA_END=628 /DNA_ORIENTATION=+
MAAPTWAFSPLVSFSKSSLATVTTTTSIFSTPPTPPRQPRRMLKKRRRNPQRGNRPGGITTPAMEFPWDTAESRPLVKSVSREVGEDYWIDEQDLAKFELQQQAIKNRKAMEGEVPKEKLWQEVTAPYKQNWIGYFSVVIAILSVIVIKFPELLDQPTIAIPDL